MPSNRAAWLTGKKVRPFKVGPAPYTPPGENEIVVKNGAIAINPVDWIKQVMGDILYEWIKYPFVVGNDLAGEVVEVGKGVNRFRVGDRVLGHAVGMDKRSNKSSESSFQEYTVLRVDLASPIPASMPYENACVLPLCVSTAACGLFQKDHLALQYPTILPKPTGKTLLVWGGSTSLGSNAIQLAVAAGYEVITTCSPKNFSYVKSLGAIEAYDYRSKTVIPEIIKALKTRESAGALAIGDGSLSACISIIAASKGVKFVSQANGPVPDVWPSTTTELIPFIFKYLWFGVSMFVKSKVKGVGFKFIWGSDLMANEVGKVIYEDFLPGALAEGKYVAAPEPQVVGKGLEFLQEACDVNAKGVSAKKVVVSL